MPLRTPFKLPWPLGVGDRVPGWILVDQNGTDVDLGHFVDGRPLIIFFVPKADAAGRELAAGFQQNYPEFQRSKIGVLGIAPWPAAAGQAFAAELQLPFPFLTDADGSVTRAHAAFTPVVVDGRSALAPAARTLVLDPNMRVIQVVNEAAPARHAQEAIAAARAYVEREPPRHILIQAPVLLIPRVFAPEFCRQLIQVWETRGNEDSGFMRQIDGKTVGVYDYSHKIRRDHYLQDSPEKKQVMYCIFHRVVPEIKKAYNFDVTRFEDFRIVCYDASRGGYFRPHRDNTTSGTAHRVWAMTINLNEGEYEGGFLRFPEHGYHTYRPGTGNAVVFSCSLLHEATDVTSGRRFALLSFLYGEQEAARRQQLPAQRAHETT